MRVIVGIPGFTSTGTRTPARHLASPCIMLRKQKVVVVGRVVRPAGSLVDSRSIVSTRFFFYTSLKDVVSYGPTLSRLLLLIAFI